MQKISSYLYPNRIQTVINLASTPLEWRIVYQRKFKIYKGLDNVLELDVKNSEQKRIDITGLTIKMVVMDQMNQEILTANVDTATGIKGIGRVIVPATAIEHLTPQFLKYSIYQVNGDGTQTPVYGDTQFGLTGTLDLLGGAMPEVLAPKVIDTFTYMDDDSTPQPWVRRYYSEAVEVHPLNFNLDNTAINLEFWANGLDATVKVQVTDSVVVSAATIWHDLETFTVSPTTDRLFKVYNEVVDYSNNINWLRVQYTPVANNTGKFDKILVRV